MQSVKLSPKFQVVIPLEIRESLRLKPGYFIQVFEYDGRIEFIPQKSIKSMKGFLRGIDSTVIRDKDRV